MNNKDLFDLNYWHANQCELPGNHFAARRNDVFRQLSQADGESCRISLGKEACFFWCWNLWATGGCHESWRGDNPGNTARECISGRFGHSGSESKRDQEEGGELDSQEEVRLVSLVSLEEIKSREVELGLKVGLLLPQSFLNSGAMDIVFATVPHSIWDSSYVEH